MPAPTDRRDVVVIGAGIVGLAVARELLRRRPGTRVAVLDKEPLVAAHQTGRNSGVVHAGVYYAPGSAKARLCREGRGRLLDWCAEHGVDHRRTGKVVVATRVGELGRLDALRRRAEANGLDVSLLDRRALADHEPHVDGLAALWVPATAVVDFGAVARGLAEEVAGAGGRLGLGVAVTAIDERADGVVVRTTDGTLVADAVVNCAGLHADELAVAAGAATGARIVPFRGEYHVLAEPSARLVRGLVYPVPDPALPFLGVHLTRGIDDAVHVGPNAVLALGREAYRWAESQPSALPALATDPAVRRLARRWWRAGATELVRSLWRRRLLADVRRLVPDVRDEDLRPAPAGIRAQAVADDGTLLDDFAFAATARTLHVVNAPSPAATASLAIAAEVVDRLDAARAGAHPGGG